MGFISKKGVEYYNVIRKDIEERIERRFKPLQKELDNTANTMEGDLGGNTSADFTKISSSDKLCVSLQLQYKSPNWNVLIENKGDIWIWYTLEVGYILKGAYYHPEDANKDAKVADTCQLVPISAHKKDISGDVKKNMKGTMDDIHDKLKNIEKEINEYIEKAYHKNLKVRVTTKDLKNYGSSGPKTLYYRQNHGNPEQYREFFMDQWLKEMVKYYGQDIKTLEKEYNKLGIKLDLNGEEIQKKAKEYGLELDLTERGIKKHIEFKKKHGYEVPSEYYALLSKDNIKDLILKEKLNPDSYKINKTKKEEKAKFEVNSHNNENKFKNSNIKASKNATKSITYSDLFNKKRDNLSSDKE